MGLFFSATATFILVLSLILEQSVITCEAKALYNDNNYATEPNISTPEDYDNFNVSTTDEMETTDPHVSMPDAMKDFMSMIEHTEEEPDISIPEDASGCSRVSYIVDFRKDFDFVLYPQSVDIGQCSGNCPVVPGHNISPYYKMILHLDSQYEPCCVPVAFAPVTVLLQVQNRVRLSTVEDLIVKTCGCR